MLNENDYDFDNIVNPNEKGYDTIVLQLGSHSIKFGYSSQFQPFIIPNCIAYKIRKENDKEKEMLLKNEKENQIIESNEELSAVLSKIESDYTKDMAKLERIQNAKNKGAVYQKQYNSTATTRNNNYIQGSISTSFNRVYDVDIQEDKEALLKGNLLQCIAEKKKLNSKPNINQIFNKANNITIDINEDIKDNYFKWADEDEQFLIGRDALSISNEKKYSVHQPIRYGLFNSSLEPHTVINDLDKILSHCFYNILRLTPPKVIENEQNPINDESEAFNSNANLNTTNKEDLNKKTFNNNNHNNNSRSYQSIDNCNLVLIVPDIFVKSQLKMILNLLFKKFNFKNIITHLESVLTSFGSALQNCCVVDVGATKTTVCCIEDGQIIKESLIRKLYGGDDITRLLLNMLVLNAKNRNQFFPIKEFYLNQTYYTMRVIEKLKEEEVELPNIDKPSSQIKSKLAKLWYHRLGKETCVFSISMIEESVIPSLLIFYPEVLNCLINFNKENIKKKLTQTTSPLFSLNHSKVTDPEDAYDELVEIANIEKKEESGNITKNANNLNQTILNTAQSVNANENSELKLQESNSKTKKIGSTKKALQFKINMGLTQQDDDSRSMSVVNNDSVVVNSNKSIKKQPKAVPNDKEPSLFNPVIEKEKDKLNNLMSNNNWNEMFNVENFPLHEIIAQSIMSVNNPELRKKFANALLVTGGVTKTHGFYSYLEEKVLHKLNELDNQIERVEVVNLPNFDGKTLTWIGASVLPKLESTKEMWISRDRWYFDIKSINQIQVPAQVNKDDKNNDKMEKLDENKNDENDDLNLDDNDKAVKDKDKDKDKAAKVKRKREKMIESGLSFLRQKTPYMWSSNL